MPSKKQTLTSYFTSEDSGVQVAGIKMVNIQTDFGKFKVWTKRIGNNPCIKVLLLHGGPALTHEYMECFESFFPKEGFELIEYDQLGSYYSDQPTDSSLWNFDHYVDEVEQVRKALKLNKHNFYLLGHSWGGLLAMEYALKCQKNLKGLIVSNMMASMPAYEEYHKTLRSQIPKALIDTVMDHEEKGQYNDPTYQGIIFNEYYKKHLCRLPDWPDPIMRSVKHTNEQVAITINGPSRIKVGGPLAQWDRSKDLVRIKVPALCIGAKYDSMDPNYMKWMSDQMPFGRYLYCPKGSHFSMWDDQQVYMKGVIEFIKNVDNAI